MIFRFGKYKGYTLVDVELIDPSYIRWARQNAPNLIPKPPQKQVVDEEGDEYIPKYKNIPIINPKDALTEAAKTLIHHFMLFSDERITLEADEIAQTETYDEESLHMRQLLKTKLIDMDLSVRALNCLKAAEVDTLGDLVSFNKNDLMKFRNFGKKSLTELEELVDVKGLNFGMDLSKYKLDKD